LLVLLLVKGAPELGGAEGHGGGADLVEDVFDALLQDSIAQLRRHGGDLLQR
jgi:hypothetical protein